MFLVAYHVQLREHEVSKMVPRATTEKKSRLQRCPLRVEVKVNCILYSSVTQPPGLNFINILRTAVTLVDPESVKNTVKSSVSFSLSGSAGL
jgi:hypothetical protein